ncbi:MAG: ribosome biogenesis GTP-binding protein YsxC [Polyangiaceae bacterium]|nr:ribosome biogenesis GTP-binding protein YsxC [Polyangiaceae bacterium]
MPPTPGSTPRVVDARYLTSASSPNQLPPPVGVEIAFAGRSNVGKSSLLNALMGRRNLARTSRTPGCTRLISFFEVKLADGALIRFVDLPGYGYARRSKSERSEWAGLIETYLKDRVTLAAVALLVDARRGPEVEERDLIALLSEPAASRKPLVLLAVATKLDKVAASERRPAVERIRRDLGRPVAGVSVTDAERLDALWRQLWTASGLAPNPAPVQR